MSEQGTGPETGNPDGGNAPENNAPAVPEWATSLPEDHQALVTERAFEAPGDIVAALIESEKAGGELKTKAEELEAKVSGFEGQAPKWMDGLDDNMKNLVKQKGWGGDNGDTLLADVIKSYQHLETAFGADKAGRTLLKPKDANDKDAYDAIYTALGRPENADRYQYTPPEGAKIDDELVKLSKEIAFEGGMNQQQYEAMAKRWDDMIASRMEMSEDDRAVKLEDEQKALSKEWGAVDGPAWSRKTALGQKAAEKFGLVNGEGKSIIEALENSFGYAATMKFMANVGETTIESDGPDEQGKSTFALTPAEAKEQYGKRQLDKEWMAALQDKQHPGHRAAVEERARYLNAIHPIPDN